MTRFICKSCNYKFVRERFDPKNACPFCGKKGTIKREETASEILAEVSNELRE